jgi:hypothetical protein
MQSIGLITKIGPLSMGDKPQMGPFHGVPLRIEVHTTGGQGLLELTQAAAADLAKEIEIYLQGRGSL